jgi:hypothetical protein
MDIRYAEYAILYAKCAMLQTGKLVERAEPLKVLVE